MWPDIAMVVAAVLFAGMGLYALAAPEAVYAQFGIRAVPADGRNESRAVYGGFGIAMAAVLVAGVATESDARASAIALTAGAALLGMAAGRIVGAALERPSGLYPVWFYFAVELVIGAALVATT